MTNWGLEKAGLCLLNLLPLASRAAAPRTRALAAVIPDGMHRAIPGAAVGAPEVWPLWLADLPPPAVLRSFAGVGVALAAGADLYGQVVLRCQVSPCPPLQSVCRRSYRPRLGERWFRKPFPAARLHGACGCKRGIGEADRGWSRASGESLHKAQGHGRAPGRHDLSSA